MNEHPLILQLDVAGNPTRWIDFETAAYYKAKDMIAWTIGDDGYTIFGGKSRMTGERSFMDLNTIIAIKGEMGDKHAHKTPSLTNRGLFRRDHNVCAYCAQMFNVVDLTRDHVVPVSRGGENTWVNCVSACGGCNRFKDDRTPDEAGMKLIYVPYRPTRSEHLLLMNRNILADQMEFLKAKIPIHSRIHNPPTVSKGKK